ncbi:unnamed protein product (macronuclear) [Paramecium tetraurelia]|uniref:Transmembrane protein n=1 Tax=Paramecium tetraurelia TaxID=5888 RepID=A0BRX8_PARTE|nr:uncharacterized protein GSPATT00031526001 [Paramecium tetraurelia]CAK61295.1 unnamed protein product [Paramecium tetraurelia]|eukprot:XP_001428693.1 hypothetical protein (macronuclear) [Paramecium tetraurelia strain d4-2]
MNLDKDCIIILDEKEEIPLQVEIQDLNTKQYLCQPLTTDKVDLTMYISRYQQNQLQKRIDELTKIIEIANQKNGELDQTQMIQNLPDIIFGPKQLQTNSGQYEFRKKFCKENEEQKQQSNQKSNVSILIYQGETYKSLCQQIYQYNKDSTKITPIVLINGKTAFKKLMRSDENLFLNFYQFKYLPFQQKFETSNHHSLYFQIEDDNTKKTVYYFVFPQELNKLDLIKFIYQGILRFIQPKFAAIAPSNVTYLQNINVLQLFKILEEDNKYFGVQSLKKIGYKGSFQDNFLGDFTDISLNLDCMFRLKQFHDPLSCIYMWERIENFIEDYVNRITKEYSLNMWAVGYNAILPKLMLEVANQELKIIPKQISVQQFNQNQFETVFNQFCELKQNINYQLKKCRFGSCRNLFQWFISKVIFLQSYFAISICFFFSFQCPYQVVYNYLGDSVGYTAITIFLPFFYAINVLLFLLLTQLYHLQDKIIEKNQNKEIALIGKKDEEQQSFDFQAVVQSQNIDFMYYKKQKERYQIKVELQEDEYCKDVSYSMKDDLLKNEIFLVYQFPQLKYISSCVNIIIEIQNYLDFAVVLFILANLILIHGEQALNEQSLQELILIASAIFVILFHFITQGSGIFRLIFKFSLLSYFWHFLKLPKSNSPAIQRTDQKKQLGSQLFLNFVLFYAFISIESYYNYSGYILIGIFAYLSIVYLLTGLFKCISNCFYNASIPKDLSEIIEVKQFNSLKFQADNQNTLIGKTRQLIGEKVKNDNKHQEELRITQFLKNNADIMNLANTIKIKVQEDLQSQNLKMNDIQLVTTQIELAIKKYCNQNNQQQVQPKQNEIIQNIIQNQQMQSQQLQKVSNINSELKGDNSKFSNQSSQVNQFLQSNKNMTSILNENNKLNSQINQNDIDGQKFRQKKN